MIKAVIFDMDGTLLDSERIYSKSYKIALTEMGYSFTEELMEKVRGLSKVNICKLLKATYGEDFDFDAFIVRDRAVFAEEVVKDNNIVKPGAKELLDFLRSEGIKYTIATSSAGATAKRTLTNVGLIDYFMGDIVTGEMVEKGKPEPDIFLKAAEMLGVDKNDCMGVEDSLNGILSVIASGFTSVYVPDLCTVPEEVKQRADYRIETLRDIIPIIKNINGIA